MPNYALPNAEELYTLNELYVLLAFLVQNNCHCAGLKDQGISLQN